MVTLPVDAGGDDVHQVVPVCSWWRPGDWDSHRSVGRTASGGKHVKGHTSRRSATAAIRLNPGTADSRGEGANAPYATSIKCPCCPLDQWFPARTAVRMGVGVTGLSVETSVPARLPTDGAAERPTDELLFERGKPNDLEEMN
jgi:hypothetical protein